MERLKSDVKQYWTPVTAWQPRPSGDDARRSIVRTFFLMRAANGVLGMLLPLIVIVGEIWWFESGYSFRGSVSAYYHSGMRDVFVGILCVVGSFLILHKLF